MKVRSANVAAEHGDLVAQDEDFDLLGSVTAQHQNQELEDASQRGVGKRPRPVIMPAQPTRSDATPQLKPQ